jgi:hypothetical protein
MYGNLFIGASCKKLIVEFILIRFLPPVTMKSSMLRRSIRAKREAKKYFCRDEIKIEMSRIKLKCHVDFNLDVPVSTQTLWASSQACNGWHEVVIRCRSAALPSWVALTVLVAILFGWRPTPQTMTPELLPTTLCHPLHAREDARSVSVLTEERKMHTSRLKSTWLFNFILDISSLMLKCWL